jgi:hypothetical protein
MAIVMGLGSFVYFTLLELWGTADDRQTPVQNPRGQSDGLRLDPPGILLRNIFRVLDHLPLLWIAGDVQTEPADRRHGGEPS